MDPSILSKKFRRLGLPPQTPLPDSEQLAGAELLHTCAHPRNLAFEMPGNRNGASDRGGDKHCDDHSRAWGWRGACPERLEKLQAVDKQLSNDTLAAGMDCFKNKKPELAERAFGKVLKLTSRRFNPKANFEAKRSAMWSQSRWSWWSRSRSGGQDRTLLFQ